MSTYSILFYLNTNFTGGETVFFKDNIKDLKISKRGNTPLFDSSHSNSNDSNSNHNNSNVNNNNSNNSDIDNTTTTNNTNNDNNSNNNKSNNNSNNNKNNNLIVNFRASPMNPGDVLIFPHGNYSGSYSNPLHVS
jgi:hypothetical protein